jgi:tyrosyl-tRNA synthetase
MYFAVQADICQLGMDQRKVNMLAREYCDECVPKRKLKPVVLSHPMMPGLLQVRCFLCRRHPHHCKPGQR